VTDKRPRASEPTLSRPIPKSALVSAQMSRMPRSSTKPELALRRALHARGLRFRVHRRDLPGTPDIVLSRARIAVFVDGCFWHGCRRCVKSTPKTNKKYWSWKIETNRSRDKKNLARLKRQGWLVYRLWEHDVKKGDLKEMTSWLERSLKMRA